MSVVKTHLSINVKNVEISTKWYESFFGMPPHKVRPGYSNFDLDTPALKLALNEIDPGTKGALNHMGILVTSRDEVLAARDRLRNLGLEHSSEDSELCCHAIQTKVWAADPDGNMWEIYTIEDDRLEDETACCAEKAKPCCEPEACNCR